MAYRHKLYKLWLEELKRHDVPSSETFSLETALKDPQKCEEWHVAGLPKDSFSVEISKPSKPFKPWNW
jgi:hypothetical protein